MGFFFGKNDDETESKFELEHQAPAEDSQVTADACSDGGYDGSAMSDVFENYDEVRKGNGYAPLHFVETRKYLQRIRDQRRQIQLLENRIKYRKDADLDTSWHEEELEDSRKKLKLIIAEVAEEISKLEDINQEVVMTKRYIEGMTWDEVAESADFKMRTVQKCHGRALPRMEKILLADGLIDPDDCTEAEDDED